MRISSSIRKLSSLATWNEGIQGKHRVVEADFTVAQLQFHSSA